MSRLTKVLLLLSFMSLGQCSGMAAGVPAEGGPKWDEYLRTKFPTLREQGGPDFEQLVEHINSAAQLEDFVHARNDSPKARLYAEFVVQSIEHSLKGDVVEGMAMGLVLHVTPPDVLLKIVVPELGEAGRLKGLLAQTSNDVFQRIQEQATVGYPARPTFDHYVTFFKKESPHGIGKCPNGELVVAHMFATDAQEAFLAMLQIDYGFRPDGKVYLSVMPEQREQVRQLQLARHTLGDYLFRKKYGFPEPDALAKSVESLLDELSRHERWWVRLYVADILRQHEQLRTPALMARLKGDAHVAVRRAAESAGWHR